MKKELLSVMPISSLENVFLLYQNLELLVFWTLLKQTSTQFKASFSQKCFSTWKLLDHKGEKQSYFFICIVAFPLTVTVTTVYDEVHCCNMGWGQSWRVSQALLCFYTPESTKSWDSPYMAETSPKSSQADQFLRDCPARPQYYVL